MTSRQTGHFFFEPRDYDYRQSGDGCVQGSGQGWLDTIRRKIVLMTIWMLSPLILLADPTMFGPTLSAPRTWMQFARHVGYLWLVVGVSGLLYPYRSSCSLFRDCRDRPGVDDQNPHRSLQRRETLLPRTIATDARRVDCWDIIVGRRTGAHRIPAMSCLRVMLRFCRLSSYVIRGDPYRATPVGLPRPDVRDSEHGFAACGAVIR